MTESGTAPPRDRDRLYVQRDKHEVFKKWGTDEERSAFPLLKDVILFAAALGWANALRQPFKGPGQHVGFWASLTPQDDVPFVQALAIAETGDPTVLTDRSRMLDILEEYANGGIDLLAELDQFDREATLVALAALVIEKSLPTVKTPSP